VKTCIKPVSATLRALGYYNRVQAKKELVPSLWLRISKFYKGLLPKQRNKEKKFGW